MTSSEPICVRCKRPVVVNGDLYQTLEKMHWLCFHLEFEHNADPDEPCSDVSCPWHRINVLGSELRRLGRDPDEVLRRAVVERV